MKIQLKRLFFLFTIIIVVVSCIASKSAKKTPEINVPKEFIVLCNNATQEELRFKIKEDIKQWKNIKTPIIARYKGNDILDYQHICFEDDKGYVYDFGSGNNSYGKYTLFENKEHYNDNPILLNKRFKIYWDWKKSEFPCCNGDYELVKAFQPSIIKLELLNYLQGRDLDGDNKEDKISFSIPNGAHCCYKITIKLSSNNTTYNYPFNMDGGYINNVDGSIPNQFKIEDIDNNGLPEIIMQIATYNGIKETIPIEWTKRYGITTNNIIIEFKNKQLMVNDYKNAL